MNERFVMPAKLRNTSLALILLGVITLCIGIGSLAFSSDQYDKIRFWIVLLHNSEFFLVVTAISVFIQAAASLAQGSWIVAYKRVPEAIGANVWLFGLIAMIIFFLVAFVFRIDGHNPIYRWVTESGTDRINKAQTPFLNPTMFVCFTVVTIGLWAYFGRKFRVLSIAQETAAKNSTKIYWKMVALSGAFLFVYALTQMSTTPWMWIMSIDSHWYSTMFSWYSWASAFVSGVAVILLWVVYLKNQGYLQIVTKEHIHDLGKFQFAFSIFWTYVWFAQFMLIWYANIPDETTYFKIREQGPYSLIWFSVFIINFIMPILILMSRPSKRNYFTMCAMSMILIFGHWLDFFIMTMPGPLGSHFHLSWYELGIFAGFAGILIYSVGNTLTKSSLVPVNNVLLKEAILHQS